MLRVCVFFFFCFKKTHLLFFAFHSFFFLSYLHTGIVLPRRCVDYTANSFFFSYLHIVLPKRCVLINTANSFFFFVIMGNESFGGAFFFLNCFFFSLYIYSTYNIYIPQSILYIFVCKKKKEFSKMYIYYNDNTQSWCIGPSLGSDVYKKK